MPRHLPARKWLLRYLADGAAAPIDVGAIVYDNGPDFTSEKLADWSKENGVEIRFIQPGKPNQNAFIERANRSHREEVLDAYLFYTLEEVREITDDWIERYTGIRPHDALASLPPAQYREQLPAGKAVIRPWRPSPSARSPT